MADSASRKTQNVGEKNKHMNNMINRTTSESMRLNDSDKILNHPTTLSATSTAPRKKTSFQITSVTVGGHTSTDGGDDSADDLDESHAEDISEVNDTSRATDIGNETPSYSEDTFSKDDVFFNSSTSLGTAPVIPTSSQYGLAIVSTPEGCNNIINSNATGGNNAVGGDLHVNVNDNVINLEIVGTKSVEGDMRDIHAHTGRNERFKVVKIESTEPFKRGRWMCMDYLDHTMQQQQQNQLQSQGSVPNAVVSRVADSNDVNVNQSTGTDSGISMADHPSAVSTQLGIVDEQSLDRNLGSNLSSNSVVQDQQNLLLHSVITVAGQNSVSPGQTVQFNTHGGNAMQPVMNTSQPQPMQQQGQSMTAVSSQHPHIGSNQHQSLQSQQMQQVLSATSIHNQQPQQMQQPLQQTMQQMQHQGIPIQIHHQTQAGTNIMPQQQYQQPQMQQIHHQQGNMQQGNMQQGNMQQGNMQSVQHNAQSMMQQPQQQQQQQTISQHIPQQTVQHQQHNIPIQLQQQINQGQMPVQVPQAVMQNQGSIQQMPQQSAQMQVHAQMQPGASQHMQHVPVQQMSMAGVVGTPQVIQTQNAQQQQYHLPTSQPMMQQGIQSQSNLMPVQQVQYYTNPQIPNANMVHTMPNQVIQTQAQGNPNVAIQQNYPVNSINQQQQPQQIPMSHTMQTAIPHLSQAQMTAPNIPVMMSQPAALPGINNITVSAPQNPVISPQPASQGTSMPLVQQYISQPLTSSIAPTQTSGCIQTYPSNAVNTVPSVTENVVQVYPIETSTELPVNQQVETLGDGAAGAGLLETEQQAEDAENAPGASAVAIDNKIEQAMDLVKSHLMFAVREEVEVLKEKIAELMDRINQLELENTMLKASATQETLAQLSSLPPASGGGAT